MEIRPQVLNTFLAVPCYYIPNRSFGKEEACWALERSKMTQRSLLPLAQAKPEVTRHGREFPVKGLRTGATYLFRHIGRWMTVSQGYREQPLPREMEINRPPNQSIKTQPGQHVALVNRVIWAFGRHDYSVKIIMSSTTDLNFFCHGEYD